MKAGNKRKTISGWLLAAAAMLAGTTAWGAMGGVGREGAYVVEIIANGKEVSRSAGTWKVGVPKELGELLSAAWVKPGTEIRLEEWNQAATLRKTENGWRSLELTLKVPLMSGPVHAVEHLHAVPWQEFGGLLKQEMLSVAKEEPEGYGTGLVRVLTRLRTVFGGAGMVAGFPGTPYEREFRRARLYVDAVLRFGTAKGRAIPGEVKKLYGEVFGEACPAMAVGRFWSADKGELELREVLADGADAARTSFGKALPLRIDGTVRQAGVFPCGKPLMIRYSGADSGEERVLVWRFSEEGETAWFILHGGEGEVRELSTRVENRGEVGVRAIVNLGKKRIAAPIPAHGAVSLCLVVSPDVVPQFRAVADPGQTPHPDDYQVAARKGEGGVVVESVRKDPPELILNNPDLGTVDVEVMEEQGNGKMARTGTFRLEAGEMGVGLPVTPHRALEVRCRYSPGGHRFVRLPVAPLGYGARSNVVLNVQRQGNPEVVVCNGGPVAVHLTGMESPAWGVDIPPGKTATVTVPAGKRVVLQAAAASEKYQCEAIPVAAMAPGERTTANVHMTLKGTSQVVLRNTLGMMDAEATLMSAGGRPLSGPIEVKKGAQSRPLTVPSQGRFYYRLAYRNGRFTAQGRMDVPPIQPGEVKVLDIPAPTSEIRLAPSGRAGGGLEVTPRPEGGIRSPLGNGRAGPATRTGTSGKRRQEP